MRGGRINPAFPMLAVIVGVAAAAPLGRYNVAAIDRYRWRQAGVKAPDIPPPRAVATARTVSWGRSRRCGTSPTSTAARGGACGDERVCVTTIAANVRCDVAAPTRVGFDFRNCGSPGYPCERQIHHTTDAGRHMSLLGVRPHFVNCRSGRNVARLEIVEHEEANRRGQIALLAIAVDLTDQFRQGQVPDSGYFLHPVPEGLFEADAGLVTGNYD